MSSECSSNRPRSAHDHAERVTKRSEVVDRAMRVAAEDQRRVVEEIARAQRMSGLSDDAIGRACQMSRWTVARVIGRRRPASLDELAAIGAVIGRDVRMQAYLGGDAIRDAGQQRLIARLRPHLHTSIAIRLEVALPMDGDRRAWDSMLMTPTWRRPVEAETVIDDVQALERRLRLKVRDGGVDGVILVIANTRRNRRGLAAAPTAFGDFDRNARRVLAHLRAGRDPGGSSILFL
jgi:hypothetical protein